MTGSKYIPPDIAELYEVHDFKHASVILANEFPDQFADVCDVLREFKLSTSDVLTAGGNESIIPKKFSKVLRPRGWAEKQFTARLFADDREVTVDTHKVDYIKGRVAFDLEWNSKDQTFDRDLFAFRVFFDYDVISVGILVTRGSELDDWIKSLGKVTDSYGVIRDVRAKYGASTTHMGKLLPRLRSGRNGGCPVLVFGITARLLNDNGGSDDGISSYDDAG